MELMKNECVNIILDFKGETIMLSLTRSGPKMLVLTSDKLKLLREQLESDFHIEKCDIQEAFEKANENTTIIFLTNKRKDVLKLSDIEQVFFTDTQLEFILCKILNEDKYNNITHARMAPRVIIMRSYGDIEKIINEISKDYDGEVGLFSNFLEKHSDGTLVVFTKSLLNEPVSLSNIYDKSVFIKRDYPSLIKGLKVHDLKYLNIGINKKDWYELIIKIYDIYGEYNLHYQRLLKVLENLQLGLILGEAWGKDAATIFMSVGIYRIRFFTFYSPEYIKKILVGLEYLEDGTRIVDLDLYNKRKKIYWSDVREEKLDKIQLSKKYRLKIFSKLNHNEKNEIVELEKEILKTRD